MICATGSQAFCPEIDKKPVSRSLIFPWIWVLYIFPSSIQLPPMAIDATDWDEGYVGIDGSRIRVVSKNCGKGVTGSGQIQQGFTVGVIFASKTKIPWGFLRENCDNTALLLMIAVYICPKNTKKYEVCWNTSHPNTFASYFHPWLSNHQRFMKIRLCTLPLPSR